MKLAPLALLLALPATTRAQAPQPPTTRTPAPFTDPANLRGERVKPRDGRELPIDGGQGNAALGLQQLLRKLNTRASILNIVAHPDDEDGGMLTFYARGLGARVADLSLTRGEGGQNAMTGDFEDALGLLRTQELLANDRYTGVDQMFGTEVDFGFSKTKEEAFSKWTHERVLYDAVRAIRLYRPLVITATFIGGVTDGHGQHQVSGQIAQEAFVAAGDPTVFPDMIAEGILPWQALKVYARVPTYAITEKGLYDYATNQFTPAKFTNYVTGEITTTPPSADVIVHEGEPDPLLTAAAANPADLSPTLAGQTTPRSYVQFARIGLGLQKSQIGPGFRNAPAGSFDVAFHLYGSCLPGSPTAKLCHLNRPIAPPPPSLRDRVTSEIPEGYPVPPISHPNSFFDGIDLTVGAIGNYAPEAFNSADLFRASFLLATATQHFDAAHPGTIAPVLAQALDMLNQVIDTLSVSEADPTARTSALHELYIKRVQLNDALVLALGLSFDAKTHTADNGDSVLFAPLSVKTHFATTIPIQAVNLHLQNAKGGWTNEHSDSPAPFAFYGSLPFDHTLDYADIAYAEIQHGPRAAVSEPYFHRESIEQPFYNLSDPALRNAPSTPAALDAWAVVDYQGVRVNIGRTVQDDAQAVRFVPKLNVALSAHAQVLPRSSHSFPVSATNRSLFNYDTSLALCTSVPDNCIDPDKSPTLTAHNATFTVVLPDTPPPAGLTVSGALLINMGPNLQDTGPRIDLERDVQGFRPIGYGDLPRTNYYTPATDRIVPVDLNLPIHHRFAYLPGTGDAVPEALASIGLTPALLTIADLTPSNLAQYDTVILGVRTYAAHPDLHGAPTKALLDYARNGGNVVVQYQTSEFTDADAPFPLSLGTNEKVVDETAPVRLVAPTSPFLTTPNSITPADFNNWVSERGHGFLSTWDAHYSALTETHDPGQADQRGGLITTEFGPDTGRRGRWTYCAFALYRQLPEAVPGAFRLFVNLLNP